MNLVRVGKARTNEHLPLRRVPACKAGGAELRVTSNFFRERRRNFGNAVNDEVLAGSKVLARGRMYQQQQNESTGPFRAQRSLGHVEILSCGEREYLP